MDGRQILLNDTYIMAADTKKHETNINLRSGPAWWWNVRNMECENKTKILPPEIVGTL